MGFRSLCVNCLGAVTSLPVAKHSIPLALGASLVLFSQSQIHAQILGNNNNGIFGRAVGGVRIDADGVMRSLSMEEEAESLEQVRKHILGPQGELQQSADLRLVSLKAVRDELVQSQKEGRKASEEVACLGGLTRVEQIFVYPERNDIVIAGPAEPWKVGPYGTLVGAKSNKPIVQLDDLLNAFKTVEAARRNGISVSIEPTKEGIQRLNRVLATTRQGGSQTNWNSLEAAMRQAFGPQEVKLEGVSPNSHLARVILAADYKMKLYGMNLAKAPVAGLPSYLEMVRGSTGRNLQSRWWMACDYSAIEHSKDKLAWKLTGRGVKAMTEEESIASDGSVKQKGKADPVAKKWADLFTTKFDDLAVQEPVFGELRNVMDLCVVAAIIEGNGLQDMAQCDLSSLIGDSSQTELMEVPFPTSLDPQCSFLQTAQGFIATASGGVLVDSWQVASTAKESSAVKVSEAGKQWKEEGRVWQ